MPRDASLSDSCTSDRCCFWKYTEKATHVLNNQISIPKYLFKSELQVPSIHSNFVLKINSFILLDFFITGFYYLVGGESEDCGPATSQILYI